MENLLKELVNNEKIGNTFFNLFERWQDEHEYEDFRDYIKVMKTSIENVIGEVTLLKGMERPFGIQFFKGNKLCKLYIKHKGGFKYCVAGTMQ